MSALKNTWVMKQCAVSLTVILRKESIGRRSKKLEVIGLDEIALKKGHRDFVTIVTSRMGQETVILGVLKDRKKETVKQFLMSIPKQLRKQVRMVCSDRYDGFIHAAKEVFGKRIQIVVDRFHVAKLYGNALDELRKKEGSYWVLRTCYRLQQSV